MQSKNNKKMSTLAKWGIFVAVLAVIDLVSYRQWNVMPVVDQLVTIGHDPMLLLLTVLLVMGLAMFSVVFIFVAHVTMEYRYKQRNVVK